MLLSIGRDGCERFAGASVVPERSESVAMKECLVPGFDLLDGVCVVVRRDGNISTVDNLLTFDEWVYSKRDVVATTESEPA